MEKFNSSSPLEFNGSQLTLSAKDGQWYVAIKPICEALNVDYSQQRKNISDDEILGELSRNTEMVAADGKHREMFSLPERYIYGWLFSIRSESPTLAKFKRECYEVLYNHFHQPFTERLNTLTTKSKLEQEIQSLKEKIRTSEDSQKVAELQKQVSQTKAQLRKQDKDMLTRQLSMDL